MDTIIKKTQIRDQIFDLQPQLVEWRRRMHQYPELGFRENLTADFISHKLKEWGIEHQKGVAKTGIVATIKSDFDGKVLAIRADMDALPVLELNEVSYKSRHEGIMHACGHDGHSAIALGIAHYLAHNKDKFRGTVKIIFQPAEEGPGGAKPMIEEGVLQNPDVDAIVGLHLWNNLPLGTVGVREGALMAAVECFKCQIFGKGGHGAMPDQTIDSIMVGSQIVNSLQTIVSRNIKPTDSAVVTVGTFQGGTALNVIADSVKMSGTVRYFNPKYEQYIGDRIEAIIKGICQSHGAKYDLDYWQLYPPVINNARITDLVRSVALDVVETPLGVVPECQTMGGEDMSFFLQKVPGCYFFLGSANAEKGLNFPHHHPRFDFDETALSLGVEMFARCVETINS
ncbi:amidohydrolase [Cyanobacterium stanieri LEGE 03274]|uniref:Amidohydrolase n=1 Tax=Cyanobacterium stanieri LEGE 03274 TaxID=1828756 RepID=A0ABR9V3E9_9CHRO|nr:M20 family metallopeptidase [Cyanobacterium stanieri]MBE9222420.1 amidohydrolase [Cyanobacterium stanieri LEGE 03274]